MTPCFQHCEANGLSYSHLRTETDFDGTIYRKTQTPLRIAHETVGSFNCRLFKSASSEFLFPAVSFSLDESSKFLSGSSLYTSYHVQFLRGEKTNMKIGPLKSQEKGGPRSFHSRPRVSGGADGA